MATKIRLARFGSKKRPVYRLVVTDARSRRDGRFIEKIGWFDPRNQEKEDLRLEMERVDYWLGEGAQPTARAALLIKRAKKAAAN